MGQVEVFVTEPRWELGWEFYCEVMHGIVIAALLPLGYHFIVVKCERVGVAAPHLCGWVVLPTVLGVEECVIDLIGFDSLLAEAAVVEALRTIEERGERKECLHLYIIPCLLFNAIKCSLSHTRSAAQLDFLSPVC